VGIFSCGIGLCFLVDDDDEVPEGNNSGSGGGGGGGGGEGMFVGNDGQAQSGDKFLGVVSVH
jgi:hypothetical protein